MSTLDYTTINLGLPAIPETRDPQLLPELVRLYNAVKILAQGVDTYTTDGTVTATVAKTADVLESVIDNTAALAELRKQYLRYTVPTFTVKGKFACNGKVASVSFPITHASSGISPSGAGTVAGAFDTAGTRDAVIASVNANAAAITEIQTLLKQFGFAS